MILYYIFLSMSFFVLVCDVIYKYKEVLFEEHTYKVCFFFVAQNFNFLAIRKSWKKDLLIQQKIYYS